ncbi:transketolase [Methylobacterium gregans]|uniref:Apulose-4-phosphate transketolase subunit A n=1 Tax=Methylobacterium gregans TaxID=374424 RepID=A0AA37HKI4_9HYPH|nr:transketolase [Methylobacterium gregans]MDQ0521801.1 transketolase [Methylobacterium gregans]GJD77051.1 Apulose-4-phosphate transketolase subunit A [Methylobacterium gregans]GLS52133.1 transketolase [Methylobacterium gregans]
MSPGRTEAAPHLEPADDSVALAKRLRLHTLRMVYRSKSSHVGSCLSVADILAVLYKDFLNLRPDEPGWVKRDRLVVSKGHAAAAVYAVLAERGFFPIDRLSRYGENGQSLSGHVTHKNNPGVEVSTGSLGHGLSIAAGFALAARRLSSGARAVAVLSDGECDEGSVWEAALFAAHHGLSNLVAVVDYNKIQSFGTVADVLALEPFADKWRAFRWAVHEIDGHDHTALRQALAAAGHAEAPTAIIAHTVKGKGVSFMEDRLLWHYRSPSRDEFEAAVAELEGAA